MKKRKKEVRIIFDSNFQLSPTPSEIAHEVAKILTLNYPGMSQYINFTTPKNDLNFASEIYQSLEALDLKVEEFVFQAEAIDSEPNIRLVLCDKKA